MRQVFFILYCIIVSNYTVCLACEIAAGVNGGMDATAFYVTVMQETLAANAMHEGGISGRNADSSVG